MERKIDRRNFIQSAAAVTLAGTGGSCATAPKQRPNIVWILAEDASAHLGCYGEKTIKTPNLDRMAAEGVRFESAFVTCPVCSPCRSAMSTGMYQTTLGAHNHRSQGDSGKGGGNVDYYDSYRLPVPLIAELFRDAGYHVTLESGLSGKNQGKTDYNFTWDSAAHDGIDWQQGQKDKPFFAQIMLSGGKNRKAKEHGTDPAKVQLPPYYPDHPVLRDDWADYLNSWVQQDLEVGQILQRLEDASVADNTVVFFLTDHGVSHLRGKQFLYEEGIQVPLIVKFPDGRDAGTVRNDLTLHIDIAATSLKLAGIPLPGHLQGHALFERNTPEREMIFSARDRCDETVDIIRCVRTPRYKYIRNFLAHLPHAQHNQYKDGKLIVQTMRQLHADGKLNELQGHVFNPQRLPEELYDLEQDPNEIVNLAGQAEHQQTLTQLREALYDWMVKSRDVGIIPEPILEDMGKQAGNKYYALQEEVQATLIRRSITVISAGEQGDITALRKALNDRDPALRYWAATGLGNSGDAEQVTPLTRRLEDKDAGVRVAAALALCRLGQNTQAVPLLIGEIENRNVIVGLYAIRALEMSGVDNSEVRAAIKKTQDNVYEFTRRIANRMAGNLNI
jgi:arylsulfatase A-like enzyme